ncbi:hypothetical protein F4778DRAFT_731333 [Xylariomycetidae sp. FL2044]|nr:hypothetical protein F4778DRAFT_731333 [Xylariomycetidae sp. FL2044]
MSPPFAEPPPRYSSDLERQQQHGETPMQVSPPDSLRRLEETEETGRLSPAPRFMQDQGAWRHFRWVPYPVRTWAKAAGRWMNGPQTPKVWKIDPFFPAVQRAPLRLLDRILPGKRSRAYLLFFYAAVWLIIFVIVLWRGQVATEIDGYGQASDISCGSQFWSANNQCGLDGMKCRPFDNSSLAFRCPANCLSYKVLNPRAVGDQEVIYAPFIVGGPPDPTNDLNPVYRADSYICGSAVHAGVISNAQGGCGVVSLIGKQENYASSQRHGATSIGFDSYFPSAFTFEEVKCDAKDVRWSLLAVSVVFSTILALFTTSPAAFFFPVFVGVFWQVGMASDAPSFTSITALFSDILGKFLPAMFCAWVFFDKMGVRRTLYGLDAQIEKSVLWLGACWVGALTNYTLDFIPIQRLTGHDLEQQPGAKAALAIIVVILVIVVVGQIWCFRQESRLIRFLKLYALLIASIIICLLLPGLEIRIHHYIIALLLLPGTSMQTRPSLLYQGLLVGLFINGIARWGFDPFLQTAAALQGDAQIGSPLPVILTPAINATLSTINFTWQPPPSTRYDGISVLVNDVERFHGYFDQEGSDHFLWTRDNTSGLDEYFRFAWVVDTQTEDYTKAGIWSRDLEWVEMKPGPSRIKSRRIHDGGDRMGVQTMTQIIRKSLRV